MHTEKDGKVIRERIPALQGNYYDYYDAVYKAMTGESSSAVTGEEGLNVIKIIEAAYQSNKERRTVDIK